MQERLQKILAHAGVASRRKAEDLIRQGLVTVNGKVVTKLGSRADPLKDHIKVGGKRIRSQPLEYYAVYKPSGVLSASSDSGDRPLVTALVPSARRLYPAGRLDFQSEGLVILSNDGELTKAVTQAGRIEKRYRVKVRGEPPADRLNRLRKGLRIGGETLAPCKLRWLKRGNNSWFEIALKQGRNRQIRRMFESIGHPVMRLRRVAIGSVQLGKLVPGGWRKLTAEEVAGLKGT